MPGPSHKARQIAWRYGKGDLWLQPTFDMRACICIYIYISINWTSYCWEKTVSGQLHAYIYKIILYIYIYHWCKYYIYMLGWHWDRKGKYDFRNHLTSSRIPHIDWTHIIYDFWSAKSLRLCCCFACLPSCDANTDCWCLILSQKNMGIYFDIYECFPKWLAITNVQEPSVEIVNFAKASCRDDVEDGRMDSRCPVLTALRKANPKKADPKLHSLFWECQPWILLTSFSVLLPWILLLLI